MIPLVQVKVLYGINGIVVVPVGLLHTTQSVVSGVILDTVILILCAITFKVQEYICTNHNDVAIRYLVIIWKRII